MAENLIRSWWDRLRGKLERKPCPYRFSWVLDLPMRAWHAGPERIIGAFGLEPGQRVLEIGPGTGYYSLYASKLLGPEGLLVGLDIQLGMLLELRRRATAAGVSLALVLADARQIPICPRVLDHVYLVAVLGEIPQRHKALAEMRRLLPPGGRLSVSEQMPDPDFVTLRALRKDLGQPGFEEEKSVGRWVYTSTWIAGGNTGFREQ